MLLVLIWNTRVVTFEGNIELRVKKFCTEILLLLFYGAFFFLKIQC